VKLLKVAHVTKPSKQKYSFHPAESVVYTHTATTPSSVTHATGKSFTLSLLWETL